MFGLFEKSPTEDLDILIRRTTLEMTEHDTESDEYLKRLTILERLTKLKLEAQPDRVSRDVIVNNIGNLASLGLITAYEQKHVWTSKAFGWIRPR